MDEKELKKLLEEVAQKNGKAISDALKVEMEAASAKLMTKDEFAQKMEAMGLKDGVVKQLTEAVEKQGLELRKFFEGKQDTKTIEEIVEEKAGEIAKLSGGRSAQPVTIKIPRNMVRKTEVTRTSTQSTTMAFRIPEVGELPYLAAVMSSLFRHAPVGPSSNGVIRYYDQNTVTRNAAARAESASTAESAITWIERTLNLEEIADSIPVTREAWRDVYFIQSELNRLLNVNLALAIDSQLWDGNGNTPNLKGVYDSAYAFDYVGDAITGANLYDLIAVLKVDVMNARQSRYMPNIAVMNPADTLKFKTTKDTTNNYVQPPFAAPGAASIDGVRIVESSQVTSNTMVLGDFNYGTIYDLEGVTVEMGLVNDQFLQGATTMRAFQRLGLLIRTLDANAFVKVTDLDAALVTLAAGAT